MNTPSRSAGDDRLALLTSWVATQLRNSDFDIRVASADASFRRYFRVVDGDRSLIAMDAPPPHEDCRPFVHVARLLAGAGVHAPTVIAADESSGFLLLTDLGDRTYLDAIGGAVAGTGKAVANGDTEVRGGHHVAKDGSEVQALYRDALEALVRWQLASREGELPAYDETLLRRELMLFPEWYVGRHLGVALDAAQRRALETTFARILASNLAQPRVYVHRDYHSRNLMVSDPNPGVLDFQDAVYGPITYDLVSLLRDAYVPWDEERVLDWAVRYWQRARAARLPVDDDFAAFWRDFEWMGVQRHLKVLGIFARLFHRDGKDRYLADLPLVLRYVRGVCARYDELDPLARLLDQLESREPRVGYTF